jgi:tetratricopeptide (TPR) repeat protein
LGGEPGVGKTRLAEEFAAEAERRGMLALFGRSYEMEGTPPYVPFVEILEAMAEALPGMGLREALGEEAAEVARLVPRLRRIFPDIPEPLRLPPEQEHRYLLNSVRAFLERGSRDRPLLLVLDDLHWADRPTLGLLEHLADRMEQVPVLVIGTYRDMEVGPDTPFGQTLERLIRQHPVDRLNVKRLPLDEVAAMLAALTGQPPPASLTEVVYAETEGNPFFVEEVFRYLDQEGRLRDTEGRLRADVKIADVEVPESVRLVIGRRIQRLSEGARRVLSQAAVVGRGFSFELLDALQERKIERDALLEAVDEAYRARLLVSSRERSEDRFAFAHELVRQTLLADLSPPRRRRLHAAVAEAIERVHAASLEEHASELANHLLSSGATDPDKTVRYLTLAGDRAMAMAARREALTDFEQALSLLSPDDRRRRADLLARVGIARRGRGLLEQALEAWREALDIYEELRETREVARLCLEASLSLPWAGRFDTALEMTQRGLRALGREESAEYVRLLASGGLMLSVAGAFDEGFAMIDKAMALAKRMENEALTGAVLQARSLLHHFHLQPRRAVEAGLDALNRLPPEVEAWDRLNLMGRVATNLYLLGRFQDSEPMSAEVDRLAHRLEHPGAALLALRERAVREFSRSGDLQGLERAARQNLDLCREANMLLSQSYLELGMVEFRKGRWDVAVEHLEEATRLDSPAPFFGAPLGFLFLCRAYRGDSQVSPTVADVEAQLPESRRPSGWGPWTLLLCLAEGLAMGDRPSDAARLYPLTLELLEEGPVLVPFHHRLVKTVAGVAAAAGKRWVEAEEHFRTALEQADRLPNVPERPEVRRFWAQMLLDRDAPGDRDRARVLLDEAVREYEGMGMPRHRELAESLLHRLAVLPPPKAEPAQAFRREGEYWAIAFEGEPFRLKDSKGLRYLAVLLANPGREIGALDLVRQVEGAPEPVRRLSGREAAETGLSASEFTDLGAVLDEQAKAAYRSRLAELEEELEEAERWSDPERAAKARQELEFFAAELSRAVGLGGRDRRAGSAAERARVNVTRAIKAAIDRIGEHSPPLRRHLERTVRTGTSCVYLPDRDPPVSWAF